MMHLAVLPKCALFITSKDYMDLTIQQGVIL